jgi:tetratricopeptide (TPR) repeat protein
VVSIFIALNGDMWDGFFLHLLNSVIFYAIKRDFFLFLLSILIPFFPIILTVTPQKEQEEVKEFSTYELIFLKNVEFVSRRFKEGVIYSEDLPDELKLKIYILFTQLILPETISILKKGLGSEMDEIRLLSFSILNRLEKEIQERINKAKKDRDLKKEAIYKWDLIYFNLVDDEFKDIVLDEIKSDLIKFLEKENDLEARIYLAKAYMQQKDYDKALEILKDYENKKSASYLMELYYYKRDFKKVKEIAKKYPHLKYYKNFYHIYRLWNG